MAPLRSTGSVSKSEAVYRELRSRILAGRYTAGYRIVLDQVAREMGVSPVPVREAIRRLEAERLVTFTRNVGAEVAGINIEDYADAVETLAHLEGSATALAAPFVTPQILDEASTINDEMRGMLEGTRFDPQRFTELNSQFHRLLCSPCKNKHLFDLLEREWEFVAVVRRGGQYRMVGRSRVSVEEHDRILELVRSGAAPAEIERAARDHKLRSMRDFIAERRAG